MRCLVTGVAGFIGSNLAERLLCEGHEVLGVDCFVDYYPRATKEMNLKELLKNDNFELREENLVHTNIASLVEGCDVVFHQAAQAGVRSSWGSYFATYCEHNIVATQRLLETVRSLRDEKGKNISKIVFASSSSVYGNAETLPTSESDRPQPVSPYGVTKLAAEHLMSLYASEYGLPTVSLRYFTVYGPRQRPDMAFNKFITAALLKKDLVIYGDGTQSRDFTYIDDIVEANVLAALKGVGGAVYNIGGGTQATVNDVLEIIQSRIGKLPVKYNERQIGDARHTGADTTNAQKDLGFQPKVSLRDGIFSEIDWLKGVFA
jgi:nucleoside-diphosphate-sugar epimerase